MRELAICQTTQATLPKIIGQRLPTEVVDLVGEAVLQLHNIPTPASRFDEVWGRSPRPRVPPRCRDGPCHQLMTCTETLWIFWNREAHRWTYVHLPDLADKRVWEAQCPLKECVGHHDKDLKFENHDWTLVGEFHFYQGWQ